ncbi:hypothetical protein [Streptomyces sp. NBC_01314]|uniref:hypothetical protein n=1 Tax=Streptomyces sp. NBC_01314 TaxID=2903821 RepID=UPI003084F763|nr:hypothetical protein OG622_45260 [Streptomyces sp. NBC_01314]
MEHCRLTDDALAGVFEAFALGPGPANGRRPDLGGEGARRPTNSSSNSSSAGKPSTPPMTSSSTRPAAGASR